MTLKTVTRDEFFAAVEAAGKKGGDPMPTYHEPNCEIWRCQKSHALFGVCTPGWRNSGNPNTVKTYAIYV